MALDSPDLLNPPVNRAAYSDRTAWLMAELSDMAYLKFEGRDAVISNIVETLAGLTDTEAIKKELQRFEVALTASGSERQELELQLTQGGFDLAATFNSKEGLTLPHSGLPCHSRMWTCRAVNGCGLEDQADEMAVLAFRGTEKHFADIKTDLDARFYHQGNTGVHTGFLNAFEAVKPQIIRAVESIPDTYKVYITGHSLGGALAIIAARGLNSDKLAACYTFGGPRVGNSEFGESIKPPIYRVVNAADMVPRLPPTWIVELIILLGKLIPIPWLRGVVVRVLTGFRGYRRAGDMRYLTASGPDFSDVRLIPNLNIIDRGCRLFARLSTDWKAGASDHRIKQYSGKLRAHAIHRLKEE